MRNLSRNANARHQSVTAGVDAEALHDFFVGQHVMTSDGLPGVIIDVQDGPFPQTEAYEVTLDDGLGGGTYAVRDLRPIDEVVASTSTAVMAGSADPDEVDPSLHLASDDYPMLAEILVERPPLAYSEPMAMYASKTAAIPLVCADCGETYFTDSPDEKHGCAPTGSPAMDEAIFESNQEQDQQVTSSLAPVEDDKPFFALSGLWDSIVAPVVDKATQHIDRNYPEIQQGVVWSYDWCRFRRTRKCFYPKEMDLQATQAAGYAVWTPFDRGVCGRDRWPDQKLCSLAQPGPKSGDPNGMLDATVSWEDGGQHGGVTSSRNDPDHLFEFTASWSDVRDKARRIRSGGGVRIISASGDRDSGRTITADVQGDTHVYESSIASGPGTTNVAMWTCGCPWAAYSWGRSGRWKKYEGRMCAHALALTFEVQSRGMFGKTITEDSEPPAWDSGDVKRPGDFNADASTYASLRPVATDSFLAVAPAVLIAHGMLQEGEPEAAVIQAFSSAILVQAQALNFHDRLQALVNGVIKNVREVFTEDQTALLTDGTTVSVHDLVHPMFHPTRGLTAALNYQDDQRMAILEDEPEPALPQTFGEDEDGDGESDDINEASVLPGDEEIQDASDAGSLTPSKASKTAVGPENPALAWLMSSGGAPGPSTGQFSDAAIAEQARAYLAKTSVKTFSPAEKQQIIDEGEGVEASNLDELDLEGTHYAAIEEAMSRGDGDDGWLD